LIEDKGEAGAQKMTTTKKTTRAGAIQARVLVTRDNIVLLEKR
jgi:hypothetical protein